MAKRLIPLLDRVLIEKVVPPTKSLGGILLPESASASRVNSGVVVATGPGGRSKDGSVVPIAVKEGDTVLLPEYGGSTIKLGEKEDYLNSVDFMTQIEQSDMSIRPRTDYLRFVLFREDDIMGILEN